MRELDYYDANKIAFDVLGAGANVEAIALVRAGYAAGYRAAQAAMPAREPTQEMTWAGRRALENIWTSWHEPTTECWRAMHDAWMQEQTSGSTEGRAAGHDVATSIPADHGGDPTLRGEPSQSPAGIKPGPLDPCPNYGAMPPSLDRQPAATPSASVRDDAQHGAASAATDGPAADPIADLCARLRTVNNVSLDRQSTWVSRELQNEAADALERLARERDDIRTMLQDTNLDAERFANIADKWKWQVRDTCIRAERAEAERDALREVVRAADAIWKTVSQTPDRIDAMAAYFTARAKVKP